MLVLAMCLSLCACGKSGTCTCDCPQCALCEQKTHSDGAAEAASGTAAETGENGSKIVFPEPVLLAEDDKVRVELISFFEENSPYKHIGKYVTLKFTSKADYEIGVRLENLAVDGSSVDSYSAEGSPNLLPGETTTYYFEILDPFKNALDTVDQLYTLKGRFKVMRRTGSNSYADSYEIPFSVEAGMNGGVSPVEAKKEYALGDTVSTDMAEFTLDDFLFRKGLATYSEKNGSVDIHDLYYSEEGMVFATSEFTLRNLSGESYKVHSTIRIYVDYNDGYRYGTKDGHSSYLSHSKGIWKMTGNGGGKGYWMELSPLMSDSCSMYLPVPQAVESDTEAPLRVIAELPASSGGTQEFIYRVR